MLSCVHPLPHRFRLVEASRCASLFLVRCTCASMQNLWKLPTHRDCALSCCKRCGSIDSSLCNRISETCSAESADTAECGVCGVRTVWSRAGASRQQQAAGVAGLYPLLPKPVFGVNLQKSKKLVGRNCVTRLLICTKAVCLPG